MATGIGSDFACIEDLDANLSLVTGRVNLAHATARRLGTPRRGLFYDPTDYGEDLRDLIGSAVTPQVIQQKAEREAIKDERVQDANTLVTRKDRGQEGVAEDEVGDMTIEIELFDEEGPFDLTLDVTSESLTVANIEELTG